MSRSDEARGNASGSEPATLAELGAAQCLILLGEPGMGKTREAQAAATAVRGAEANVDLILIGRRTDVEQTLLALVEGPHGKAWADEGRPWWLFLDGVDEAPGGAAGFEPALRQFLSALASAGGPVDQLRLRLFCRTAEWSPTLEGLLHQLWPDEVVLTYQLEPLTLSDVRQAIDVHTGDAHKAGRFMDEMRAAAADGLATRPVSLSLLAELFDEAGALPTRQAALYEQGLEALLAAVARGGPPIGRVRTLDAAAQLTLAGRIAAACRLTSRPRVWAGLDPDKQPADTVALTELAAGYEPAPPFSFPVQVGDLIDIVKSPLFETLGSDVYGWAHQTFPEFLTARYLVEHGLSAEAIIDFLSVRDAGAGGGIAPQLREVAAWAATLVPDVFERLLDQEPDILLQSDIAAAEPAQRARLVASLLAKVEAGDLFDIYFELVPAFHRLAHPGLADQLRDYILDQQHTVFARRAAIDIAEATALDALAPMLADLALTPTEPLGVRRDAAFAVAARLKDPDARARLAPLARDLPEDENDDLKGAALRAAWPNHLTFTDLLAVLAPRKSPNYFGSYALFLRQLTFGELSEVDALVAADWVSANLDTNPTELDWPGVVRKVFWAAASRIDAATVRERVADLISRSLVGTNSWLFEGDPTEPEDRSEPNWGGTAADRVELTLSVITRAEPPRGAARLLPHVAHGLVRAADLPHYLAELARASDPARQETIAELILGLVRGHDLDSLDVVWEASQTIPALQSMLLEAYWVPLDGSAARWMREDYRRQQQRTERQAQDAQNAEVADTEALRLLANCEAGHAETWWRLNLQLFVNDQGHYEPSFEFRSNLKVAPGWRRLSAADQERALDAAERYVREASLTTLRWLGTSTQHRPASAAVRALRLLAEDRPSALDALPPSLWARWAPAIISFFDNDWRDSEEPLKQLAQRAYRAAPTAVRRALARMALGRKAGGIDQRTLQHLSDAYDEALGDWLARIRLRPAFRSAPGENVHDFLLNHGHAPTVRALLEASGDTRPEDRLTALGLSLDGAGRGLAQLMAAGSASAWDMALSLVNHSRELAEAVWSHLAELRQWRDTTFNLDQPPDRLVSAYVALLRLFPERPDHRPGPRYLGRADHVEWLRESIVSKLVATGTVAAVQGLERLAQAAPEDVSLPVRVQAARRVHRAVARQIQLQTPRAVVAAVAALTPPLPLRSETLAALDSVSIDLSVAQTPPDAVEGPSLPLPIPKPPQRVLRIMAIATEWSSGHGGLSTLNREFCIALAELGHDVACVTLDVSEREIEEAKAFGVRLINSPKSVGIEGVNRLLLLRETHLGGFKPDLIVGHDHVTGPQALAIADRFGAAYVHMLHTVPQEAEALKGRSQAGGGDLNKGYRKASAQRELGMAALLVVGVGPKIAGSAAMFLDEKPVHTLNPGLNATLLSERPDLSRRTFPQCYFSGRIEDGDLKGVRIAANGVKLAGTGHAWGPGRPKLVVRGFPDHTTMELFREAIGDHADFAPWVQTRPFTDKSAEIHQDLRQASVVLMPSLTEGFGLAGLEAIAAGVPVIVSMESGLAMLLFDSMQAGKIDRALVEPCIADTVPGDVVTSWGEKILAVLLDREAAFTRALALRSALLSILSWRRAAEEFTREVLKAMDLEGRQGAH